jgi:nucleotide-binding universal stress UspA family protein
LRVVDIPLIPSYVRAVQPDVSAETNGDPIFREEAEAYLRTVRAEFETSFSTIAAEVVDSRDPAGAIVTFCDENAVDLVVMVSHCRSGISRWLLGSITQKVLQAASCPVLVVPRKLVETETEDSPMMTFSPDLPLLFDAD